MECDHCGSVEFHEENGFYFCVHCQTQSQGFAKEVVDEDDFAPARELVFRDENETEKKGKKKSREGFTKWNTIQAFNIVYLAMIEDFFRAIDLNNLQIDKPLFKTIAMQLWFKYLRESEIAFIKNEHLSETSIKLHPSTRYRDNQVLRSNVQSDEPLPFTKAKEKGRKFNYSIYNHGRNYAARPSKRFGENQEYMNDDFQTSHYKDPRKITKSKHVVRTGITKKLNELLIEANYKPDNFDPFLAVIKNITRGQDMCTIKEEDTDTREAREESAEEIFDESNFDNVLKERMSSKCQLFLQHVSLEKFKDFAPSRTTPLANEMLDRYKLLTFLYLTIRLLNYNIFLSDLLRWCIDGSMWYSNQLNCLPSDWEIMWLDSKVFRTGNFANYLVAIQIIRNMIIHCGFPKELLPEIDLDPLINRYLKDMNLPRGLLIVIRKNYGSFLKEASQDDTYGFPQHDLSAIVAIIMALRDLFDLFGCTTDNFRLFENIEFENLFLWSKWFEYSKLRFNLIKAFNLNIVKNHNVDLVDIDELLRGYQYENNYSRTRKDPVNGTCGYRLTKSMVHRNAMQDLFRDVFFCSSAISWKESIRSQTNERPIPTFYPLTSETERLLSKIRNKDIKATMELDFRKQLITPYMCNEGYTFHRRTRKFSDKPGFTRSKYQFFDDTSPEMEHLIELGSYITCTNLSRFMPQFFAAEKNSFEDCE